MATDEEALDSIALLVRVVNERAGDTLSEKGWALLEKYITSTGRSVR